MTAGTRYLPLHERDAAAHSLLTYLAARHPNTPLASALAEAAGNPLNLPAWRDIAGDCLAVAQRSQADLARVLLGTEVTP